MPGFLPCASARTGPISAQDRVVEIAEGLDLGAVLDGVQRVAAALVVAADQGQHDLLVGAEARELRLRKLPAASAVPAFLRNVLRLSFCIIHLGTVYVRTERAVKRNLTPSLAAARQHVKPRRPLRRQVFPRDSAAAPSTAVSCRAGHPPLGHAGRRALRLCRTVTAWLSADQDAPCRAAGRELRLSQHCSPPHPAARYVSSPFTRSIVTCPVATRAFNRS